MYLRVVLRSESGSVFSRSAYIFRPRTRDVGCISSRGDYSKRAASLFGVVKLEALLVALRPNDATLHLPSSCHGRTE